MNPGDIQLAGLPFAGSDAVHGFFMATGIALGLLWFAGEKRRRGLHDDRLWTLAGFAVAFGAIGARLLTWPRDLDPANLPSLSQWLLQGNTSIVAGLIGAWLGVLLGKRLTGYRSDTGDLFAPAVALAMTIGRVGCLLTELPGTPTGTAWGIVLTPEQAALLGGPAGVPLHPSFVYEIAFHAIAFALLVAYRDRLPNPGDLFACYVAAYALFRFGVEFVRGNETVWYGLTRPQWVLLALLPLLARRVVRIVRSLRAAPSPVAARTEGA